MFHHLLQKLPGLIQGAKVLLVNPNRRLHTSTFRLFKKGNEEEGAEADKEEFKGTTKHTNIGPQKEDRKKYRKENFWFIHRQSANLENLSRDEMDGVVGASNVLSISTKKLDAYFPTLDTMRQIFDGIEFIKLPVVYVCASYTNTVVTCADAQGNTLVTTSSGREGFKNAQKKTILAGQATGAGAAKKLTRRGINTVRVVIRGIGPGRLTAVKALASAGINVVSITDRTPIPELGPRPRKIRRV